MEALEQLKSVLCDPEGSVCISGSDGDRKVIADALESLEQQVAALRVDAERLQFFYNKIEVCADGWVSEAIFIQRQDGCCDLGDAIDAAMKGDK